MLVVAIGPHTSEWVSSPILVALFLPVFRCILENLPNSLLEQSVAGMSRSPLMFNPMADLLLPSSGVCGSLSDLSGDAT